jgi:hypothetical protein
MLKMQGYGFDGVGCFLLTAGVIILLDVIIFVEVSILFYNGCACCALFVKKF